MRTGQAEIIYLVLTIGIAFIIAAGIFAFSNTFQSNINEQLATAGLERTSTQLEAGFLEMKNIIDSTSEKNSTIKLLIPAEIGGQRYSISGDGTNTIELRTIGSPSIPKLLTIKFWNVTVRGFVGSEQGFIQLELKNATSVLLK
jgi:hypothetical protein